MRDPFSYLLAGSLKISIILMTLEEIRQKFVELSGRYDLADRDNGYADQGANWHIQRGQDYLDEHIDLLWAMKRAEVAVDEGDFSLRVPRIRSVRHVLVEKGEDVWELRYVRRHQLKSEVLLSEVSQSRPVVFSVGISRDGSISQPSDQQRLIAFGPPADQAYTFHVEGLFYSAELVDDDDWSWWSTHYPETLIQAAYMSLERFNRNRAGIQDHLTVIEEDLRGLEFDQVDEQSHNLDQLEDSWYVR